MKESEFRINGKSYSEHSKNNQSDVKKWAKKVVVAEVIKQKEEILELIKVE
jgi:hypothetical protein